MPPILRVPLRLLAPRFESQSRFLSRRVRVCLRRATARAGVLGRCERVSNNSGVLELAGKQFIAVRVREVRARRWPPFLRLSERSDRG